MDKVIMLNPTTCGIYKNGGARYKVDPVTGRRTAEIDNEMAEQVAAYLAGQHVPGLVEVPLEEVWTRQVLVPRYFDSRWDEAFSSLCEQQGWSSVALGALEDEGVIVVASGHGSPSNDARTGHIPYVKVSDIRSLRVNINPTNLVSEVVAQRFWRGKTSGLNAWDLITPNRASSNIGEFAILLPGEEQVVLTKEMFVIRVVGGGEPGWSPFYLLWAFCLKAVRDQWRRITLMQTNREDVGKRYREILIPRPSSAAWAEATSADFRTYFTMVAQARASFQAGVSRSGLEFIASTMSVLPTEQTNEEESNPNGDMSSDDVG